MTEKVVDLGAIRGDWDFHSRYVTNAMEQTLKRLMKYWRTLKAQSPAQGQVPVDGQLMVEFIEACRQTRALTDDFLLLQETKSPAPRRRASRRKAGSAAKRPAARRKTKTRRRKAGK